MANVVKVTWQRMKERAQELYEEEGQIEFDDKPQLSTESKEKGAYVQAWVWVPLADDEELVP